jgi:hypothetical protein
VPALSYTALVFAGATFTATSASVKDMREQIDVTSLTNTRRQYQASPLLSQSEATLEFLGYGPRAGATGSLTLSGVAGIVGTVVSSSTTFSVNEPIRSQATVQFAR